MIVCDVEIKTYIDKRYIDELLLALSPKFPVTRPATHLLRVGYEVPSRSENRDDINKAVLRAAKKIGLPADAIYVGNGSRE